MDLQEPHDGPHPHQAGALRAGRSGAASGARRLPEILGRVALEKHVVNRLQDVGGVDGCHTKDRAGSPPAPSHDFA